MITLYEYGTEADLTGRTFMSLGSALQAADRTNLTWVNLDSAGETNAGEMMDLLGVHRLSAASLWEEEQRARFDEFDGYFHIVLTAARSSPYGRSVVRQVHLLVWTDLIVSVCHGEEGFFTRTIEHLRMGHSKLRGDRVDFLLYMMLDELVDNYGSLLAGVEDHIDELDTKLMSGEERCELREIYDVKSAVMTMRRMLTPMRETVSLAADVMTRGEDIAVTPYMRDLAANVAALATEADVCLDMLTSLTELYMANQSNSMNATMKVLTVVSSIFIPMTFIAGIYGMNFHFMPEMTWQYGYPFALGLMAATAGGLVWFFKRKGMM